VIDLGAELFEAQRALTRAHQAALIAAGVSRAVITLGLIGAARVAFEGTAYRPDDDGKAALIVPARVDPENPHGFETEDPAGAAWLGDIVDLVAFPPELPDRWALRIDVATALGAYLSPRPVLVHRTPLDWLIAGADGLCLLTGDVHEQQRILSDCHELAAEDAEHAAELRRILRAPCFNIPRVRVTRRVLAA
jgi:hypothetical protein